MTKFIMLMTCALLVIPVLYFIPLKVSTRDKLLLMGLSFVLAFGGLFVFDLLSYWMSVGAILCFAFCSAYIAEKKMSFLQMDAHGVIADEPTQLKTDTLSTMKDTTINEVEIEQAASIEGNFNDLEQIEEVSVQVVDLEIPILPAELETQTVDLEINDEEGTVTGQVPATLEEVILSEEEFAFLEEGRNELDGDVAEPLETPEMEKDIVVDRSLLFEEIEDVYEPIIEDDSELVELESLREIELEEVLPSEEIAEAIMEDSLVEEVTEELTNEQPDMDPAVQDMLLTTLQHYNQIQDTDSYHSMLNSILQQTLSDKDYYLFVKLLLDSYILTNHSEEAKKLLLEMKERLSGYPVILEEMHQYSASLQKTLHKKDW